MQETTTAVAEKTFERYDELHPHGRVQSTILTTHVTLLHLGMVVVGLPYAFAGQMGVDEIVGGSPYGASTIAGGDGGRMPSGRDLDGVRFQARHLAQIGLKLKA